MPGHKRAQLAVSHLSDVCIFLHWCHYWQSFLVRYCTKPMVINLARKYVDRGLKSVKHYFMGWQLHISTLNTLILKQLQRFKNKGAYHQLLQLVQLNKCYHKIEVFWCKVRITKINLIAVFSSKLEVLFWKVGISSYELTSNINLYFLFGKLFVYGLFKNLTTCTQSFFFLLNSR